jgi:hypothetical protein
MRFFWISSLSLVPTLVSIGPLISEVVSSTFLTEDTCSDGWVWCRSIYGNFLSETLRGERSISSGFIGFLLIMSGGSLNLFFLISVFSSSPLSADCSTYSTLSLISDSIILSLNWSIDIGWLGTLTDNRWDRFMPLAITEALLFYDSLVIVAEAFLYSRSIRMSLIIRMNRAVLAPSFDARPARAIWKTLAALPI